VGCCAILMFGSHARTEVEVSCAPEERAGSRLARMEGRR
jgi:hypothetical protein